MPPARAAGALGRGFRRPASDGHLASRSSPCGRVAGRWPARPATIADRTTRTLASRGDSQSGSWLRPDGRAVASSGSARFPLPFLTAAAWRPQEVLRGHSWPPLVHNRPRPGRGEEPFTRNAISRDKSVHEPIVRRPAHPQRLFGVLVIGRVAAKPQAQLARAPEGSVKLSLSLGGVGKLISVPRPKVMAVKRQVQLAHPPVQMRAHKPPSQPTQKLEGGGGVDVSVNL